MKKQMPNNSLNFDKTILSNNRVIIPVLAAIAILFPFELFNPAHQKRLFPDSEAANFTAKKIFQGENFFTKSEFFKIGQHDTFELNSKNNESFQLGRITDISVFGNESNVIIAGDHGAVILDKTGNIKDKISFKMGKFEATEVEPNSTTVTTYSKNAKPADLENDGIYEFAGIASNGHSVKGVVLNNKGEIIREFKDGEKRFSIRDVTVKDVDGDGEKEIIVEYSGMLKFFNLKGEEKWSQTSSGGTLSDSSFFTDIDGDGQDEILNGKYLSGTIRKLKSDKINKIKRPYEQHGFLVEGVQKPLIVFFDQNKLGLFDFDGNLAAQYQAPLSDIEKGNYFVKEEDLGLSKFVQPFKASAVKVKLKSEQPEYLAVLVTLSTKTEQFFVDMLYIYNDSGEIVYQEATGGDDHQMKIMPLENGTQSLLIQEKDSIWLYKAN